MQVSLVNSIRMTKTAATISFKLEVGLRETGTSHLFPTSQTL